MLVVAAGQRIGDFEPFAVPTPLPKGGIGLGIGLVNDFLQVSEHKPAQHPFGQQARRIPYDDRDPMQVMVRVMPSIP
jgi:hypothetical protein